MANLDQNAGLPSDVPHLTRMGDPALRGGTAGPARSQRLFFENLDALRGLCAMFVALYHVSWTSHVLQVPVLRDGWVFVDFFFVLSGFVISHSYASRIGRGPDLGGFLIKRIFRLYPLHLFAFFLTMGLTLGGGWLRKSLTGAEMPPVPSSDSILETLFLVQSLGFSTPSFNTPSWSISAELWTYVLFGLLTLFSGASRAYIFLVAAISAVAGFAVYRLNQPLGLLTTLEFGFPRCIFGFFLGCVLWRIWRATTLRPSRAVMNALHAGLFFGMAVEFIALDMNTNWNFILPPTFAAVIYSCAIDPGSALKSALSTPVSRNMGKLSYSFYMLHTAILIICSFVVSSTMPALKYAAHKEADARVLFLGDAAACVYLALIVAASFMSYRFIEAPSRKWGAQVANALLKRQ